MKAEYIEEKTWVDDLGTHRTKTVIPKAKKPRTLKKDLARFGKAVGKVAGIAALVIVALAALIGLYLLIGWGLALGLAFVTGGAITLSALQGAVALILITFLASLFRSA